MDVSGEQLTKYISGEKKEKKKTFSTGSLMDNLIYFLNSNAGCSTTSFKKYHARYHARLDAVAEPRQSLMSTVNSSVWFLQNHS